MEVGRTILVLFGLMTTENFWKQIIDAGMQAGTFIVLYIYNHLHSKIIIVYNWVTQRS